MQVNLENNPNNITISGYEPGQITLQAPKSLFEEQSEIDHSFIRKTLTKSLIVMPERLIENWGPIDAKTLSAEHIDALLKLEPEIVLFGTGEYLVWPDQKALAPLTKKGIGVEIMATGAACRTYNILMSDERRFLAALIP